MAKAYFNTKKTYIFGSGFPKGTIRFLLATESEDGFFVKGVFANLDGKTLRYIRKQRGYDYEYLFELLEDAPPLVKGSRLLLSYYGIIEQKPKDVVDVIKTNDLPEI